MPIKPENAALYPPPDWKAISIAAKERAGWKCAHAISQQYRCRKPACRKGFEAADAAALGVQDLLLAAMKRKELA